MRKKEYTFFFPVIQKTEKKKGKMMFTFIVRSGNQKFYRQIQIHFQDPTIEMKICIHALNLYMHKK